MVDERKQDLFRDLEGTVLDLGAGTGPNLSLLPPSVTVIGVEPNPFMHGHYLEAARKRSHPPHLIRGRAEALPFPDDSVDAVLATLVLCSVGGIGHVLTEVLRVLRPGGKLVFVEHVAAPEGTWLRRVQRLIRPAWRYVGDGCEPDRTLEEDLRRAGFQHVSFDSFTLPLPIVGPHLAGFAVK
jgi:ubiquinone/menaquinone biosynthesis C-methylase UbiE